MRLTGGRPCALAVSHRLPPHNSRQTRSAREPEREKGAAGGAGRRRGGSSVVRRWWWPEERWLADWEQGNKPTSNQPESNPKTGPLAWIRGGFPHPPIYGQIVSFDKAY